MIITTVDATKKLNSAVRKKIPLYVVKKVLQAQATMPVKQILKEWSISDCSFYTWRKKYGVFGAKIGNGGSETISPKSKKHKAGQHRSLELIAEILSTSKDMTAVKAGQRWDCSINTISYWRAKFGRGGEKLLKKLNMQPKLDFNEKVQKHPLRVHVKLETGDLPGFKFSVVDRGTTVMKKTLRYFLRELAQQILKEVINVKPYQLLKLEIPKKYNVNSIASALRRLKELKNLSVTANKLNGCIFVCKSADVMSGYE